MQIRIDLKIILVLLIFFITNQLEIYLLFMFFTILHELGHLIMGMILGFKLKGIQLIPMGLSICFHINCNNYNINIKNGKIITLKKLLIAIAGPTTNFLIAIFFIIFKIKILNFTREEIIYSNIYIGIFNLIPIYPLDGGRIIKNIIHINANLRKSYKYTNLISNITLITITAISSISILYLKNISILLIIIYLWILLTKENNNYNKKMQLYKLIDDMGNTSEMYEYDSNI